jgi:hypothetical protein
MLWNLWACSRGTSPYACAYWNEWPGLCITALSFWRFSLLTTDPVICGIARGDADEHFVRRNPKECVIRWRVVFEVGKGAIQKAVERLCAFEVVGFFDARAEVGDVWRLLDRCTSRGRDGAHIITPHKAANRVSRRPLTSSSSDRGADLVVKGKTLARRALSGKNHDICVSSWEKGSHPMWVTAHRRTYGTSRTSGRLRTHRARGRPSRRTLNVAPGA